MTTIDYEAEYNNRRAVPEYEEIAARWAKATAAWVAEADILADQPYGPGERQRYDLFRARGATNAPLVIYIHGGYWQRGDRKAVGFVTKELNARGIDVACPSYSLAPAAKVTAIMDELRQCVKTLYERTKKRPVVVGHSAGGHLAAAMLATDWSALGLPANIVRAAYAISGAFDPEPLIGTSLNDALRLDITSVQAANVIRGRTPPPAAIMIAAVGGNESQEFIRQSLSLTAIWSRAGVKAECVIVPNANHFTIVDEVARSESAMLARIVSLANG